MKEMFLDKDIWFLLGIPIIVLLIVIYPCFSKYICEKNNGTFVSGSQGTMCIYEKER